MRQSSPCVRTASLRHRFDQRVEFSTTLEEAGYQARMEVLEAGWVPVDAALAGHLEVERGTMAYRTIKRWFADDQVAMVATETIPFDPVRGAGPDRPLAVDPADSLFTLVQGLAGDVVDWEIAYPSAATLRRSEARCGAVRVGASGRLRPCC